MAAIAGTGSTTRSTSVSATTVNASLMSETTPMTTTEYVCDTASFMVRTNDVLLRCRCSQ